MTGRHHEARHEARHETCCEGMVRAQAPISPAGRPTGEVAA